MYVRGSINNPRDATGHQVGPTDVPRRCHEARGAEHVVRDDRHGTRPGHGPGQDLSGRARWGRRRSGRAGSRRWRGVGAEQARGEARYKVNAATWR